MFDLKLRKLTLNESKIGCAVTHDSYQNAVTNIHIASLGLLVA